MAIVGLALARGWTVKARACGAAWVCRGREEIMILARLARVMRKAVELLEFSFEKSIEHAMTCERLRQLRRLHSA
jgi:hypothetical protein